MQLGILRTVKLNRILATLGGIALVSCATPKAVVIEAPAAPKKVVKAPQPVVDPVQAPVPSPVVNEGLRMPDMLALPTESEFRASNPTAPKMGNEAGAVIARPPKTAEP